MQGHYNENYPGFADVIQGPWLMEQMQRQAEHVGTEMFFDVITEVDFTQRPFRAKADSGDLFTGDTVIIATGAQARWLGLESERTFAGAGVSACATCDGFFFRGKEIALVGGGNTAVEEALYLTNHASKVTVIHRRDTFRAEKIMQERLFRNPKIQVVWDTVVDEILVEGVVDKPNEETVLKLRNEQTGEVSTQPVEGVFIAIGHDPATKVFQGKVNTDPEGYILTAPDSTATNVPGVFAAGDVKDKVYRQAVTAAGMGCMAALEAEKFLAQSEGSPEEALREATTTQMIGAWD